MSLTPRLRSRFQDHLSDYIRGLAWSANGKQLAAISAQGELVLWSTHKTIPHSRIDLTASSDRSLDCLGFSSDGQFLAVGGQAGKLLVWKMDLDLPQLVFEHTYAPIWIDQLAWNPVSNQLALGVGRQVHLWDLQAQILLTTLEFESSSVLGLVWHPLGQYLAVSGHGGVKVWDLQHPQASPTRLDVPGASLSASWSQDGRYLASGNLDRTLSVLNWGSPPPWLMQGFPGKVSQLAWSDAAAQSGSPLLAAACVDGITVWRREQASGGNWTNSVLTKHEGLIRAIAFQPRSSLLASGGNDNRVFLWRQAQQISQTLPGLEAGTACLAWHPSGQALVGGGMDGTLLIWTADSIGQGFG